MLNFLAKLVWCDTYKTNPIGVTLFKAAKAKLNITAKLLTSNNNWLESYLQGKSDLKWHISNFIILLLYT